MSGFSPTEFVMHLVEAKGVSAAVLAGVGGSFALGFGMREALQFGAVTALGVSLGDAVLTGAGVATKIQSYLPGAMQTYVDPMDFVGSAAGAAILNYSLGLQGRPLAVAVGVAAVAGGLAPKVAGYIVHGMGPPPDQGTPSQMASPK